MFLASIIFLCANSHFSLALPSVSVDVSDYKIASEDPTTPAFWYKLIIAAVLIILGGIFAGLTLGLMGLDELHLRVLAASSDDPIEKRNAQKGFTL